MKPLFRLLLGTVIGLASFAGTPPPAVSRDPATPAPVPGETAIEEAGKLVREVHKADYAAKKPADLTALARKLLKEADETTNDPAAKFVLYREARDFAARGGDVPLALDVVAATTRAFAIKPAEFTLAALDAAEKARAPGRAVAEAALDAADEAIRADDYPAADRLLKLATGAATRTAGVPGLAATVAARAKDLDAIRKGYEATEPDRKAVRAGTADAAGTGRVGRFLCLVKGDWEAGLPLLAKGDDEKLKTAAELELAKPETGADKAALADRWWDLSAGLDGAERSEVRVRAYHWYQEAAADLNGLSKTRVDKRLAEIEKAEPRVARAGGWTVIFRSADPSIWNTNTNRGRDQYAIPLGKAPSGIKYLKMTNVAKKDFVVIEMTKARLSDRTEQSGYGWNGQNMLGWKGYHMGIYDTAWNTVPLGGVIVYHAPFPQVDYRGWGFGHRFFKDDQQGFTWSGEPVEKTVLEISVKASALITEEAKHLLKKK